MIQTTIVKADSIPRESYYSPEHNPKHPDFIRALHPEPKRSSYNGSPMWDHNKNDYEYMPIEESPFSDETEEFIVTLEEKLNAELGHLQSSPYVKIIDVKTEQATEYTDERALIIWDIQAPKDKSREEPPLTSEMELAHFAITVADVDLAYMEMAEPKRRPLTYEEYTTIATSALDGIFDEMQTNIKFAIEAFFDAQTEKEDASP